MSSWKKLRKGWEWRKMGGISTYFQPKGILCIDNIYSFMGEVFYKMPIVNGTWKVIYSSPNFSFCKWENWVWIVKRNKPKPKSISNFLLSKCFHMCDIWLNSQTNRVREAIPYYDDSHSADQRRNALAGWLWSQITISWGQTTTWSQASGP